MIQAKPKFPVTTAMSVVVFLLSTVAMQLYWNKDHYFAMMKAKGSFVAIITIACMLTFLTLGIERWSRRGYNIKRGDNIKKGVSGFSLLDWAVLLFGVSAIIVCLICPSPAKAFTGELGMMCGTLLYVTGTMVYFIVSRFMRPDKWILSLMMFVWAVIFLWAVLNQLGIDFFGLHENMRPGDIKMYIATIGNVNAAADSFCLTIPIGMVLYLFAEGKRLSRMLGLYVVLGLAAICFSHSEGSIFGMMFFIPFLVVMAFAQDRRTDRFLNLVLMFSSAVVFYHWTSVLKSWNNYSVLMTLSQHYVGEIMLILCIAVMMLRRTGRLQFTEKSRRITITVTSAISLLVLVGVVSGCILYSLHHPAFGATRGAIWKGSFWTFRIHPLIYKIFGTGPGFYADNVTLAFSMLMGESELRYATCHDSLLQALLGQGIFGLACLLTGVVALVRCWCRELRGVATSPATLTDKNMPDILSLAALTGLICYFGCSLVESTYPHPITLLYAILGLFRCAQLNATRY